jgi:hypothetical protein
LLLWARVRSNGQRGPYPRHWSRKIFKLLLFHTQTLASIDLKMRLSLIALAFARIGSTDVCQISAPCYTSPEGDVRLGGSAMAATEQTRSACLFLRRDRTPAVPSAASIRFGFAPARRKRDAGLRHGVLQAIEGLLLPETEQERAPERSRLERNVAMSGRLWTAPRGVWDPDGESGRGSGRRQADRPRIASENRDRISTRIR